MRADGRLGVVGDEADDAAAAAHQPCLPREVHARGEIVFVGAVLPGHGEPIEELQADALEARPRWAFKQAVRQRGPASTHNVGHGQELLVPVNMGNGLVVSYVARCARVCAACLSSGVVGVLCLLVCAHNGRYDKGVVYSPPSAVSRRPTSTFQIN